MVEIFGFKTKAGAMEFVNDMGKKFPAAEFLTSKDSKQATPPVFLPSVGQRWIVAVKIEEK